MDTPATSAVEIKVGPDPYAANPRRQWWLVVALSLACMMAVIDRTVLSLLFDPIKADLQLTDLQMSLVFGLAFAIANFALTIPAGYLADRISRRGLIAAGSVLWSVATSACGLAGSFGQLLGARAAVGGAEAVIHPCSFSMMRGALSPERRGRGFSFYAMSIMFGSGLGFLLGALLLQLMTHIGVDRLPLLGETRPWRLVMLALGVIGLPFTLLMLMVREPARTVSADGAKAGWGEAFAHLRRYWAIYLPLLAYGCFHSMQSNAYGAFLASIPARKWGVPTPEVGRTVGMMMLVLCPLGLLASGWMMDRLARTQGARGAAVVGLILIAMTMVSATATPLMPNATAYFTCIGFVFLTGGAALAVTGSILAAITPERIMGRVSSIQLFLYGILGLGMGPTIVGLVSDKAFHGEGTGAIALAMGVCNGAFTLIALVALAVTWLNLGRLQTGQERA